MLSQRFRLARPTRTGTSRGRVDRGAGPNRTVHAAEHTCSFLREHLMRCEELSLTRSARQPKYSVNTINSQQPPQSISRCSRPNRTHSGGRISWSHCCPAGPGTGHDHHRFECEEESWKRAVAADCVVTLEEPDAIKSIAAAVSTLPIAGKITALTSLRNRHHPAVRDAALQTLTLSDIQVRTVALQTLITSGTADDVATLADLATGVAEQPVREAACRTLCLMTADGTNQVLRSLIMAGRDPSPVLLECALERRAPEFVPAFLHAARSSSQDSRLAAFKALADHGDRKRMSMHWLVYVQNANGGEAKIADVPSGWPVKIFSDPANERRP